MINEFVVDISTANDFEEVVTAFNIGLIIRAGGNWSGISWDAFHDYLSWPSCEKYTLTIIGWNECAGLSKEKPEMIQQIFNENCHITVKYA